jgi:hypothetical protein
MNMNIPAPVLGALQKGSKIQNGDFLKNSPTTLIKLQQFMKTITLSRTGELISSENNGIHTRGPKV